MPPTLRIALAQINPTVGAITENADRIARAYDEAKAAADLVVFPRCGHFPMIEAVHASNRRLVKFLSEELRDEVSGHSRFPAGGEVAEGAFLTEVDGGVNSATPPISFSASPLRALAQDTRAHLPPDGEEMP